MTPVFINVYDLPNMQRCNACIGRIGFGAYHTAIQIGKHEFTYGGNANSHESGIYLTAPRKNSSFVFKYSIPVFDKRNPENQVLKMTEFEIYHVLIPRMG